MTRPRGPFLAANWKMHKGPREAQAFADDFKRAYGPPSDDRTVALFPPSLALSALRDALADRPDIGLGVQDVHQQASGAHTGGISAGMAAQAGAAWVLAGHSERRREFGDSDDQVAEKTLRILEAGLAPVLCVGETLEEREAGQLETVVGRQLRAVLDRLESADAARLTYAYEPVWAIGTGRTASPADASEAHGLVRKVVSDYGGADFSDSAVILYGGSVKPENVESLLASEGVDGALVGGASLDPDSFAQICKACPPPEARGS